jgi:hypothetical protein
VVGTACIIDTRALSLLLCTRCLAWHYTLC